MSIEVVLYALLTTSVLSGLIAQRLTTTTTGPDGVVAVVTLLRLVTISLWVTFGIMSGYWQILVVVIAAGLVAISGTLAKGAKR